ncbi:hypothetical protein HC174_05600 [Salinimicrobium sp. CDJ15-81-2]|uniref:Uncharacterized protein n=1 Tax=Salinimicrobium oceani TaxID=2722702 RepID=A0ABX1D5N7_9FLAO|nr:hypothetical protein [Salinimicrobium oceani]NJY62230.1 hypothetical protein [Salinimicrobium nanhaiense]
MSILIEVIVGAVLSFLMSTGEIEHDRSPEKIKTEQVSKIIGRENCEENNL